MQKKQQPKRKKSTILGDSMVKGVNEYGLSKNQNVRVESVSGNTTEHMLDIAKPAAWRKLDATIISGRINDITREINTMKNVRKIVKSIQECSENTQVLFFGIMKREEGNYNIIVWNNQTRRREL